MRGPSLGFLHLFGNQTRTSGYHPRFLRDSTPGKQIILDCVSESIRHSYTDVCLLMPRGVHTDPWVVLPLIGPEPHMLEIGSKQKHQP